MANSDCSNQPGHTQNDESMSIRPGGVELTRGRNSSPQNSIRSVNPQLNQVLLIMRGQGAGLRQREQRFVKLVDLGKSVTSLGACAGVEEGRIKRIDKSDTEIAAENFIGSSESNRGECMFLNLSNDTQNATGKSIKRKLISS
jgi:hypothetical protein